MDGEFHRCGNAQKLWLNNASRSFIYSAQGANVPGSGLFSWVQGAFDSFLAWISGQGGQYQLVDEVVQKADWKTVHKDVANFLENPKDMDVFNKENVVKIVAAKAG